MNKEVIEATPIHHTSMETNSEITTSKDDIIESYTTTALNKNNTPNDDDESNHTTELFNNESNIISTEFLSKISELWIENSQQKQRIINNSRKELPSSILDEITPPGNRNSFKNFVSPPSTTIANINEDKINNNHIQSDIYEHTPINGTRTDCFITKQHYPSQYTVPSSTPMNKINTNVYSNISNDNSLYGINRLLSNNDLKSYDQIFDNYELNRTNNFYKSATTITPPNSFNDHITMLGDSFNRLSTTSTHVDHIRDNSNNYSYNGNSSLWTMSGVSKLPHPSFIPQLPNTNSQTYINKVNTSRFDVPKSIGGGGGNDFEKYYQCNEPYPTPSPPPLPLFDYGRINAPNGGGNMTSNISFQNPTKPSLSWIGKFPVKNHPDPLYSNKVFLGGLPWDITEQGLYTVFKQFGPCTFEWPGKDNRSTRHPPKGYVYLIFENERSVKNLLQYCYHDEQRTQFYFKLKTHITSNEKSIQVIPWILANSSYLKCSSERLDITKTVFVGGLHGKITAENLALVFEELFGTVIYAGIDTDKNKYPIGSGRVTFADHSSYKNAIKASFVQINGKNFCKKVQIDPYLEDSVCQFCTHKNGPFFCKDFDCLKYYCKDCWVVQHCNPHIPSMINHRPINRQNSSDVFEILNSIHFYSQVIDQNAHPPEITNIPNNLVDGIQCTSDRENCVKNNPPGFSSSS